MVSGPVGNPAASGLLAVYKIKFGAIGRRLVPFATWKPNSSWKDAPQLITGTELCKKLRSHQRHATTCWERGWKRR